MTFAHIEALGFVDTTRGKNGGIRLSKDAERVSIGAVVRKTEPDLNLLECFDPRTDHCTISTVCRLKEHPAPREGRIPERARCSHSRRDRRTAERGDRGAADPRATRSMSG